MLSTADILDLADVGANCSPVERALLVAATYSGVTFEQVAALPLGQRNALLLEARRAALGDQIECRVACPECAEALEFVVKAGDLLAYAVPNQETFTMRLGELLLTARLPNGGDLVAIAGAPDSKSARQMLIARCVLAVETNGDLIDTAMLPDNVVMGLSETVSERDPLADVVYRLECPACTLVWNAPLDIAAFVWHELVALAERLLTEVHALAYAYSWREADILALSPRRRARYLAMLNG